MTRTRKSKYTNLPLAKKAAWKEFSRFIRLRDSLLTCYSLTQCRCVTCDGVYPTSRMQAGHFIPGRNNQVLFDEDQVHAQCARCNMNGGMWVEYERAMVKLHGVQEVERMKNEHGRVRKYTVSEMNELELSFREKANHLLS